MIPNIDGPVVGSFHSRRDLFFSFIFYQIPSLFLPKSLFFFSLAYILRRVPGGSRQGGGSSSSFSSVSFKSSVTRQLPFFFLLIWPPTWWMLIMSTRSCVCVPSILHSWRWTEGRRGGLGSNTICCLSSMSLSSPFSYFMSHAITDNIFLVCDYCYLFFPFKYLFQNNSDDDDDLFNYLYWTLNFYIVSFVCLLAV